MSELKPESENTEERLSDTEEAISQKADAETNSDAEPAKNADIDEESPAASEDEDFFYDDNGAYEARRAARKERRNKNVQPDPRHAAHIGRCGGGPGHRPGAPGGHGALPGTG